MMACGAMGCGAMECGLMGCGAMSSCATGEKIGFEWSGGGELHSGDVTEAVLFVSTIFFTSFLICLKIFDLRSSSRSVLVYSLSYERMTAKSTPKICLSG